MTYETVSQARKILKEGLMEHPIREIENALEVLQIHGRQQDQFSRNVQGQRNDTWFDYEGQENR